MNDVMSPNAFKWFVTFLVFGLAAAWVVYDSFNLFRTRNHDRTDPVVRDKHFGYVIGVLVGVVGVVGVLRFHGVL